MTTFRPNLMTMTNGSMSNLDVWVKNVTMMSIPKAMKMKKIKRHPKANPNHLNEEIQ